MANSMSALLVHLLSPLGQGVILVTIVLIAIVVAIYFLLNYRDRNKKEMTANDHLTDFREMHRRGMINDSEFRTIKAGLGRRLRQELENDSTAESEKLNRSRDLGGT